MQGLMNAGQRVELSIRADIADMRRASDWLASTATHHGVPEKHAMRLDQCLDEALANVITHGGPTAQAAPVRLAFVHLADADLHEAALTVIDAGRPFNPLAAEIKPKPATLLDAEPGGLGLTLMRTFADELAYDHCEGFNHLTMIVRWPATQGDAAR